MNSRTGAIVSGRSRSGSCHRTVGVGGVISTVLLPKYFVSFPCRFLYTHLCLFANDTPLQVRWIILFCLHSVTAGGCGDEYHSKSICNQQASLPSTNPTNIFCLRVDTINVHVFMKVLPKRSVFSNIFNQVSECDECSRESLYRVSFKTFFFKYFNFLCVRHCFL